MTTQGPPPPAPPRLLTVQLDFCDLNEHGLFALDARQYERAVTFFRHALIRLNKEREQTTLQQHEQQQRQAWPAWFYHSMPLPLELLEPEFIEDTASQDGHFYLYDTAFMINYEDIWQAYPFAVTTLLYNLALSLHIQGLEQLNQTKLDQARQVYDKALNFFTTARRDTLAATRDGDRRVLLFALVNNYGHTCALLLDHVGVQRAEDVMKVLLEDPYSAQTLIPADLGFFRMTHLVGYLRKHHMAVSPAA